MLTATNDACFQLRTRWFDPSRDKWITVDLIGPYTLTDAISEAQHVLMLFAGDVDRAYVAIEDMRQPIPSLLTGAYSNADLCTMVGLYGTSAYHNTSKKG